MGNNNFDIVFADPKSKKARNDNVYRNNVTKSIQNNIPHHMSTCRTLQRKLEMKVERAKRNYSQYNQSNAAQNEVVFEAFTMSTHKRIFLHSLFIMCCILGGAYHATKCQCQSDSNQSSSNSRCTGKCAAR